MTIAETYQAMYQPLLARKFRRLADKRQAAIHKYMWSDTEQFFMDYDFTCLQGTLIIENHESFYRSLKNSKNTLIIWGSGWKASRLKHLHSLFPKPIFYWGDLDKEGYEIYGYIKKFIPDLNSIFMDLITLNAHPHLSQKKTKFFGPYRQVYELQKAYEWVCSHGLQIEQEQLPSQWPYHLLLD
jgi:hypothetical protein